MSPLYWGIGALGLLAVLFEPLREALWELGEAVGGVGGVGGLTNQYGPTPTCNTTEDLIGTNETAPYCFHPGFSGFTPFGALTILLATVPLAVSALATHFAERRKGSAHGEPSPTGGVTTFSAAWGVACCLWWFVPLASYLNSPWYRTDAYHAILAVSISSAFPLSWHMAFVAIPASGAPFLAPLLGLSESALKVCHIRSAWASVFWACVHVGGQLFYLLGTSSFVDSFALSPYSDNLLFWFGAATILLLLVHAALAKLRHHPAVQPHFRSIHRALAFVLLLSATTHWWPFALFLAPAVAVAATGLAVRASTSADAGRRGAPIALASALAAAVVLGVAPVWAARQAYMLAHPRDFNTPFVFPPAAVALAFVMARGAAAAAMRLLAPTSAASVMGATLLAEGREP